MQLITNNARALLAANLTAIATSLTVEAGKADTFDVATTTDWLTPLDWYKVTLQDASGNIEIVKVGSRTLGSGVMSVLLRGQDGTTARAFTAGTTVVEQRITKSDIQNAINAPDLYGPGTVPVGAIIMYDGLVGDLPANFKVCDGTAGTPDLRDKFIVGATNAYALGASGGSKDAVVVAHDHDATFTGDALANHDHSITDAGHQHSFTGQMQLYGNIGGGSNVLVQISSSATNSATTGIDINPASAGTPAGDVAVASEGVSGTDKNLPPYYALIFIKRVS